MKVKPNPHKIPVKNLLIFEDFRILKNCKDQSISIGIKSINDTQSGILRNQMHVNAIISPKATPEHLAHMGN